MILDKEKFKEWVEKQEGRIGMRNNCCYCPIGKYLTSLGHVFVFVTPTHWSDNYNYGPLPNWVQDFIHKIDSNNKKNKVVTKEEALEALANE